MLPNSNQIDPINPAYQGYFRNAAAGLIKSLIRARARQEPTFLASKDYDCWGVTGLDSENRPCAQLLTHVRQLRARFEEQFLENRCSVSEPNSPELSDNIEILAERVAGFICGDLDEAIRIAANNKKVPWDRLANWGELTNLRDALDQLPPPPPTNAAGIPPVAQSGRVTLYGPGDEPVVNGKNKPRLTPLRYELIKRLIEAGEDGCTKSQLESISSDHWKSLTALKNADPDWDQVIRFAGKSHGRYRID